MKPVCLALLPVVLLAAGPLRAQTAAHRPPRPLGRGRDDHR
jgi:hypothetical protein